MYPQILSSTTWGFSTSLTQISFSEAHNFEKLACYFKKIPLQLCMYMEHDKNVILKRLKKFILACWKRL